MTQRYDHPNVITTREVHQTTVAGNATIKYFRHYQKIRLKGVHAAVNVAGTATTNTFVIKSGTTALGTFALSTSTQGVTSSIDVANTDVAALGELSITGGADTVGVADIIWEFEVLPDAVRTG